MPHKIIIASGNPIKIQVARDVIEKLFPHENITLINENLEDNDAEPNGENDIKNQIIETIQKARTIHPTALYYIGMGGGIVDTSDGIYEAAYTIVENTAGDKRGVSQAASFPVPPSVAELVRNGSEFGKAVDQVFKTKNIKTGQGFVGLLTKGIIDKYSLYYQPTVIALCKILEDEWFTEDLR